jgi:hypothetical protein
MKRHCPKCASSRLHRSHCRGLIERTLRVLGGEILRCHDCRARRSWFGSSSIPLSGSDVPGRRVGIIVLSSGFLMCVSVVWWIVTRFAPE